MSTPQRFHAIIMDGRMLAVFDSTHPVFSEPFSQASGCNNIAEELAMALDGTAGVSTFNSLLSIQSGLCLGAKVKVKDVGDEAGDASFIGKTGIIFRAELVSDDTLYGVRLNDGREDGFWAEELELC